MGALNLTLSLPLIGQSDTRQASDWLLLTLAVTPGAWQPRCQHQDSPSLASRGSAVV